MSALRSLQLHVTALSGLMTSVYSFADGHLGCFHLLVIMNRAAMNIYIQVSESLFSVLLNMYPRSSDFFFSVSQILSLPFWELSVTVALNTLE